MRSHGYVTYTILYILYTATTPINQIIILYMYIYTYIYLGFRRIAYHQDRPDILSKYKVYMEADKTLFPILLSNGNQLEAGGHNSDPKLHYSLWEDPFPKPSYLFAVSLYDMIYSVYDIYVV